MGGDIGATDVVMTSDQPAVDRGLVDISQQPDAGQVLCAIIRYNNLGTSDSATIEQDGVKVTGSDTIHVLDKAGLGIVDHLINDGEWIQFEFSTPQIGVAYELSGGSGKTEAFAATIIEAFDASGASLGTKETSGTEMKYVSELFDHAPITRFKLQPHKSAGIRVGAITYGCCKVVKEFTGQGTSKKPTLDLTQVTIHGSADLQLTDSTGLGVVGGSDEQIDGSEWVQFSFVAPMRYVSYLVSSTSEEYVNITYDIIDGAGTHSDSTYLQTQDTFVLTKYDPISGFKILADGSGSGHTVSTAEFWADCSQANQ